MSDIFGRQRSDVMERARSMPLPADDDDDGDGDGDDDDEDETSGLPAKSAEAGLACPSSLPYLDVPWRGPANTETRMVNIN